MGALVADVVHQGNLASYMRSLTISDLAVMAEHIVQCEYAILPETPSWWMGVTLPAIDREIDRRCRPKPVYSEGSPIDRLRALDLATVARCYTELNPAGTGKLKGLCPLHQEKTPSFYVYQDSHRWRCYGACATGGSVIDLLAAKGGVYV